MAKRKADTDQGAVESQFFEIVNWKKAQSRMKGGGQDWLKLYTSLLEHDGFAGMDDSARMLIITLWMYAARSGLHILPADPAWLKRRISILNGTPDLEPLLSATDVYGNSTPFVRYCKPPKARGAGKGGKSGSAATGAAGGGKGKGNKAAGARSKSAKTKAEKKQGEKNRVEESRGEKREQMKPLRVSGEEKRERKERTSASAAQTEAEQQEPEKPENPIDSEAGSAKAQHIVPRPTRSVTHRIGPQRVGTIIAERFPDHWTDSDAEAFGWEIVRALGYPDDRQDAKSRSEWGAFAAWWSKVKALAPALALDDLRATAIRKADYLRLKGRSAKNKSKVWFYIMNGELHHRGVPNDRQARASP